MPSHPTKSGNEVFIVQTAHDLGFLTLEQANGLLTALDRGEVDDPLAWMGAKKLVSQADQARILELVDNPEGPSDSSDSPFSFSAISFDAMEAAQNGAFIRGEDTAAYGEGLALGLGRDQFVPVSKETDSQITELDADCFTETSQTMTAEGKTLKNASETDGAGALKPAKSASKNAASAKRGAFVDPPSLSQLRAMRAQEPTKTGRPPKLVRNEALKRSEKDGGDMVQGTDVLPLEEPHRYSFRYLHACGGQARILVVHDEQIGRDVALKVVSPENASFDDVQGKEDLASRKSSASRVEMQRLLREARVTGQLEHPNIIPVYDMGRRKDGALYYTMRFVRGVTLSQRLKACRNLGERLRLLKPFLDICNAIAYAHSRGVIHRDLKPANAMVGEFGETVLLDWGIAKVRQQEEIRGIDTSSEVNLLRDEGGAKTIFGEAIGTPGYMSPEQAQGLVDVIDERSDVFGLGAILFQILTGQPPYKDGTEADLLIRASKGMVPDIQKLEPSAPGPLVAIAKKALQTAPEDRYQTAKELANEIDSYMTGRKVASYDYSSRELLFQFAKKNRLLLVFATLLLIAILQSLFVGITSLQKQREANQSLEEARRKEHAERFVANLSLTEMYARDAFRDIVAQRFGSAEKNALLSLSRNPNHPKNDVYRGFARDPVSTRAQQLRVSAASALYQARLRNFVRQEWVYVGNDAMTDTAFSPDSKHLAVGSYDGFLRVFDVATGAVQHVLHGHHNRIITVAYSPDGRYLATTAQESDVILRDTSNLDDPGNVTLLKGHQWTVRGLAFSDDSTRLATAGMDGTVRLWDVSSAKELKTFTLQTNGIDKINANAVVFSSDQKSLLVGSSEGKILQIDLKSGRILPIFALSDQIWSMVSYPGANGHKVFVAGMFGKSAIEIDEQGAPQMSFEGHTNSLAEVACESKSGTIATASYDGTIRLWNGASGLSKLAIEGHRDFVTSVAFSPDGKFLVSAGFDKTVRLWRRKEESKMLPQLVGHTEYVQSMTYSPDGKLIASGGMDKVVRLWNPATREQVGVLRGHTSTITEVHFSQDGSLLVSSSRDGTARLWDVRNQELIHVVQNPDVGAIESSAISHSGKIFVTGGTGTTGSIYLWDVASGRLLRTIRGHSRQVKGIVFSKDDKRIVTASRDKTVAVFEVETGRELVRIDNTQGDWFTGVIWGDSDEKSIITAGKDGMAIRWDLATQREIFRVSGHRQWINLVQNSPSGELLATASDDKTVRIWNAQTGEPLLVINTATEALGIAFSPDEKTLAVGDGMVISLYPLDFSALNVDPGKELQGLPLKSAYGEKQ